MSKKLRLEPGEHVVVSTLAHPSKLLKPAVILVIAVFVHGLLQRMLEVRWRPMDQPWTTVHSVLGTGLSLLLLLVVVLAVIRPVIRWALTRFVLTNRRLMLVGGAAPRGGVRINLAWLLRVDAQRARGPLGRAGIGTLSADFGQSGVLRLHHAPRVEQFAELIDSKAANQRPLSQGSGSQGYAAYGAFHHGQVPGSWVGRS
ncbi:PH domain-containing protein [Kocuria sp.]|uniref:PH domain-containing protein n=1 Tax=Kocuria sp. TaxID=1871328 RepID=UPI0026E09FAD|nr:PH domain-containing protein [Kocuria sp.]MDO5619121.1 PH domain-containing protein [Kocuria sp.]